MDRRIEFTADDLGLDVQTNLAIEHAHREGALTAASLMLGQPATAHAVEIARCNPRLQIGWHFHACDSAPVTQPRWPWGNSPARAALALMCSPAARVLVRREIQVQWQHFTATGLNCAFINGHHHLHIHPFIAREMQRTISFNGWVRGFTVRFFAPHSTSAGYRWLQRPATKWLSVWPCPRTDTLWGLDRLFCMRAEEVATAAAALPAGHHEFMFHPRREGDADHQALVALRKPGST